MWRSGAVDRNEVDMYQQDPWSSPPPPVTAPPTTGPIPPVASPAPLPPPRRDRRPLIVAAIAGLVVVSAVAGTLFATGVVDLSGEPDGEKTKESARAKPDEPSVNPDDTHYKVAAGLCEDLDVSDYEELSSGTGEAEEEVADSLIGDGTELKCLQTFDTDEAYVNLTIKVTGFPSVLRARLDGYGDYSTSASDYLEDVEPVWIDGDWEKAQFYDADTTGKAIIVQDDNLAMYILVNTYTADLDQDAATEAIMNTTAEILKTCET